MTWNVGSLPVASRASAAVAERAAQPLDFVFLKCCGCQHLLVGISCYGQSFFTGASLHIPEPVICGVVPGAIVNLGVELRDAGWGLPQFFSQQCGNLPMLEAFFDRVQDLLADMLLCLLITAHPPQQPSQLVHIMVDFCDLLSGWFRVNELYGRWLCLQVSLHWWLLSALVDGMVVLPLPHDCSMEEILCSRNWWWGPPSNDCWCSLRYASALSCLSTSLTDMPFSSASLFMAAVFAVQFWHFKLSSVW